jgi:hypothetical protein
VPLPTVTKRRRLIQRFKNLGWEGPIEGPDHPFMKKGKLKVKIPNRNPRLSSEEDIEASWHHRESVHERDQEIMISYSNFQNN